MAEGKAWDISEERYTQLRQIFAVQVLPELKEIRRRQSGLQWLIWIEVILTLSVLGVLLGAIGAFTSR